MSDPRGMGFIREEEVDGEPEHNGMVGVNPGIDMHFGGSLSAYPGEALALANALPALKTQGGTNSCVGHGIDVGAEARCRVQGINVPPGSPLGIYNLTCMLQRKNANEPLRDEGSYARIAMKACADFGVPQEIDWPLWNPDGSQRSATTELPPHILQRASAWKLKEQFTVYQTGQARIDACCKALAQKFPLPTAGMVDEPFMNYNGSGVLTRPDPQLEVGGHMTCIIGYRTNSAGKKEFLIVNSWVRWGMPGSLAWVDEEWVKTQWEIYAFTITKGPNWLKSAGVERLHDDTYEAEGDDA